MPDKPRGPVCVSKCGPNYIDKGTMCLAKSKRPGPLRVYVCRSADAQAAHAILGVLADRAIGRIQFTIDSFALRPALYAWVARLIQRNQILVEYDRTLGTAAYYDPEQNKLQVGFTAATTLTRRALVVHECTHAVFDALNYAQATVATSEAAAHIAQMIFFEVYSPDAPLVSEDEKRNLIYYNAGYIAEQILKGRTPTAKQYEFVKRAIADHPDYWNWRSLSGWNGV